MAIIQPTSTQTTDCAAATATACPGAKACAALADWEAWKKQKLDTYTGSPIDYSEYRYVKGSTYHCPIKNKDFPI